VSAGDIGEHLRIPAERIRVAYPGIDPRFQPEGEPADLGAPYVLTVSTLDPRKNVELVIEAFELLRLQSPGLILAVVGGTAPGASAPLDREGVRMLGFFGEWRLARLYRAASAFACARKCLGYGMLVAGARARGLPTVASYHPPPKEESGTRAFRATPESLEAIAGAVGAARQEGPGRGQGGVAHARRFTWEACGEAVLRG